MPTAPEKDPSLRVLALAPTARDAEVTRALLAEAGVNCVTCPNLGMVMHEMETGAGAALLTEDAFNDAGINHFLSALAQQPPWSELPILILMRGTGTTSISAVAFHALRNVTLLERPAPMRSLVSAVQSAIRSRRRQYQIRDQIQEIRRNEREREALLQSERAARTDAEHANHLKDEFLATVSHELRTPLNAILGWAQVLSRLANDPGEVLNGIEIIERNARLQPQLIEDLLDMSRIISGKIRLDIQPLNPAAIVDSAIASVQPAADAKHIVMQKIIDPAGTILADPGRLQQILWNLLSNAVKFTPDHGKILVTLRRVDSVVELRVADSGKGIDPAFLPHVFERFRQADASTTRQFGGLGLGLAIVKNLVDLHGGTIQVESAGESKGAAFTITLPLSPVRPDESHAVDSAARASFDARSGHVADFAGIRVLVVDDDADARRLVKRLLAECKAEVTTAASAAEALTLLPQVHPHVLISDIGMPEMDGYQFIHKVRASFGNAATLPAVAVTAFARSEDRRRALLAGYQTHISKPVEPPELLAIVASLVGRAPVAAAAAPVEVPVQSLVPAPPPAAEHVQARPRNPR